MAEPTQNQRSSRTRLGIWRLMRGGLTRFLQSRVVGPFRRARERNDTPRHLELRILVLGIVLAAAYLWLLLNQGFTHLQMGIYALAAILTLAARVLSPAPLKRNLKHKLFFMLRTPVLLSVSTLFVCASLFWSSVQVSAAGVDDRNLRFGIVPATDLADVGGLRSSGNDTMLFRTSTLPWGRLYVITVEGCPPYSFTLWPWKAGSLHVNEVLDGCPSLLLRIPAELHSVLAGGKVRVHDGPRLIAEIPTESDRGAILLGRNIPVPGELKAVWRNELEARGLTDQNAARSLYNWRRPIHVVPQRALRPQMRLSIAFETRAGVVLAGRKDVVVGKRWIEDVPLLCVR